MEEKYLIVSIDVEEDMPNWEIEEETTIRNLESIPMLQSIFDKTGVKPTYLLNYPYATSKEAVKVFNSFDRRVEVGCHMHNWNTPPFVDKEEKTIEYPSNLSYERQFQKIKSVTDELEKAFGYKPVSYRAGKFGFNNDTKDILVKLGFLVDTSITPLTSWKENGGPDFFHYKDTAPFWFETEQGTLLEVPVSIGLTGNLPGFLEELYFKIPKCTKLRGLLSRDYLNLIDLIWIYPALFNEKNMIQLVEILCNKTFVANMFFHSSEVKTGESIYTNSEKELKRYTDTLKLFFDYAVNEKKMIPVTLSEFYDICKRNADDLKMLNVV